MPVRADRVKQLGLDREVEPRGERDRADHAHRVFAQADVGIADRSHDSGAEIVEAADVIDHREVGDVVEQRVDREIAAERVFFGRAERVVAMNEMFAFRRGRIRSGHAVLHHFFAGLDLAAERRHFDDLLSESHVRQPEAAPDDPAVPKQLLDLIGMRRRPDVEILWPAAEQQIAHAAAHEVRGVVELSEPIEDLQRIGVDVAARDRMLRARNNPRFDHERIVPRRYETRLNH